jgi:hypothetical protein
VEVDFRSQAEQRHGEVANVAAGAHQDALGAAVDPRASLQRLALHAEHEEVADADRLVQLVASFAQMQEPIWLARFLEGTPMSCHLSPYCKSISGRHCR